MGSPHRCAHLEQPAQKKELVKYHSSPKENWRAVTMGRTIKKKRPFSPCWSALDPLLLTTCLYHVPVSVHLVVGLHAVLTGQDTLYVCSRPFHSGDNSRSLVALFPLIRPVLVHSWILRTVFLIEFFFFILFRGYREHKWWWKKIRDTFLYLLLTCRI